MKFPLLVLMMIIATTTQVHAEDPTEGLDLGPDAPQIWFCDRDGCRYIPKDIYCIIDDALTNIGNAFALGSRGRMELGQGDARCNPQQRPKINS